MTDKSEKTFFELMDDAAKHMAEAVAKAGVGENLMPLDDAGDVFKGLVQYAALKLKYKEDGPDEDEDSFSGFQARLKKAEAEEERNGAATVHGRTRRRPS